MSRGVRKGYYCPHCNSAVDAEDSICLSCNAEKRGAWPVDPYVGRTVGRKYKIIRRITASDEGTVFAATQMHQGTELGHVIVKMLSKKISGDSALAEQFVSEARSARTLTSPHMVRVFDLDFDAGHIPYLVMENVVGDALDDVMLQEEKLEPSRALSIALQVAEAMEEAHRKKILHRNLRPSHIIVRQRASDDFVKIIGFGLARAVPGKTDEGKEIQDDPYLPPEVREGAPHEERSDIWSLGAILYEMLAGQPPEEDRSVQDLVPDLPMAIVETVDAMVQTDPEQRPADMGRVAMLLEQAAHEAGYTTDITGRITLPADEVLERWSSPPPATTRSTEQIDPPPMPPALPSSPPRSRGGHKALIPAVIVLGVLGVIIVLAALSMSLYLALGKKPAPQAPPAPQQDVPAKIPPPPPPSAPETGPASDASAGQDAKEQQDANVARDVLQTDAKPGDSTSDPLEQEEEKPPATDEKKPRKSHSPKKKPAEKQKNTSPWTKLE